MLADKRNQISPTKMFRFSMMFYIYFKIVKTLFFSSENTANINAKNLENNESNACINILTYYLSGLHSSLN